MKKLGLIGGTGPESTIEYYRQVEYGVQNKTGHFPSLTIESLSVFEVLSFCDKEDYEGLTDYLLKGFQNLADAGCNIGSLTGITPHIVFEQLKEKSSIPIISMIDVVCDHAQNHGYTNLALFGTYPTMSKTFFKKPLEAAGIKIVVPNENERRYIGDKIEKELELGIVKQETQQGLCKIIQRLISENHIQGVILGCTELPLILNDEIVSIPCLDAMAIHIQELIDFILEKENTK